MESNQNAETNLKKLREKAGLSQNDLAVKSGVAKRVIQVYEQRYRNINTAQGDTLYKLAKALKCRMEALLELDEIDTNK